MLKTPIHTLRLHISSLTLPQGRARHRVVSDCRVRVEQDAWVSGFVECSRRSSRRKRFSARPGDGKINALRVVLHAIRTLSTMGTKEVRSTLYIL